MTHLNSDMDFGNKLVIDVDNGIDSIVSSDAFGAFHTSKIRNRDAKHELKNTDDVTRTTEHDKIKDEVETAHIEITASSIKVVVGLTELEVSSTEIKGTIAGHWQDFSKRSTGEYQRCNLSWSNNEFT